MRLIYHPDAETELIEAARYYESRIARLGVQFLDEADRAVATILQAPRRWRIIDEDVRGYLMPRFPYAVYYRDYPDRVHLLLSNITVDIPTIGDIASPGRNHALQTFTDPRIIRAVQ